MSGKLVRINHINPRCYCGNSARIWSGLFERNFCSDDCIEKLRKFFGSIELIEEIEQKSTKCGDFVIKGTTVTLAQEPKYRSLDRSNVAGVIDRIDAEVAASVAKANEISKMRKELQKMGLDPNTIETMLKAHASKG